MNDSDSDLSDNENPHQSTPDSENSTKKRRLWTKQEDEKLRLLVSYWGDQGGRRSNWDKIAANFENRTPKNCRKRWFHSLDPKLRRGKWSKAEDKILKEAYEQMGASWQRIAQLIPGRTDDQCAKRYNDVLNPAIVDRLRPWTAEEDAKLRQLREELGPKWQQISTHLPGRTGLTIRNRYRKLTRSVRTVSEHDLDISGDIGPQAMGSAGRDDGATTGHRSETMSLGGPPPNLENPLPFDVPGAMQGAGFPAGSDPTWLHMGHAPSNYPQTPYYGYQNGAYAPNATVLEASDSTQLSSQFGTPVYAQLHQNVPISGTRRQFSVTLGSQDTTPLTFLRDEHQSITGNQLEQIMEFAARHRQQLVVHQHIYQVTSEHLASGNEEVPASVVSTTTVVRPSVAEPAASNQPQAPAGRPPLPMPANHLHQSLGNPRSGPANPMASNPPTSMAHNPTPMAHNPNTMAHNPNTMAHNPNPMAHNPNAMAHNPSAMTHNAPNSINSQMGPAALNPSLNPTPPAPSLHSALDPSLNQQRSLPDLNEPPRHPVSGVNMESYRSELSPPSRLLSPAESVPSAPPRPYPRQNSLPDTLRGQLNRPAPSIGMDVDGASLRRPPSILPEHTPDEFLSRPLLFEEMHEGARFDPDDLDFLAFNPS